MNKNSTPEISQEQHERIMNEVFRMIRVKGLKRTTMDALATSLGMSKRTIYEIYGNKYSLLIKCLKFHHKQRINAINELFNQSHNAMEALYKVFYMHLQFINNTSVQFFEDMDEHFKNLRPTYDENTDPLLSGLKCAIDRGIAQGVFRAEINYTIAIKMFTIQMEALKRMEDYFPKEITGPEVFHAIVISFLRTIATPKGVEILDDKIRDITENPSLYNINELELNS